MTPKRALYVAIFTGMVIAGSVYAWRSLMPAAHTEVLDHRTALSSARAQAVVAGGCFWCVEADLEKYHGVISAVSGYMGGQGDNPQYTDYAERGFREVVEVTYDPTIISYENVAEYVLRHSDPTDAHGSFYDRGSAYTPALYFENDAEKKAAQRLIKKIDERGVYDSPLAVEVLPRSVFYPAEEYHQDYYKKNPLKYAYYRQGSGRDAFIEKHWGLDTVPVPTPTEHVMTVSWRTFKKPDPESLRKSLSELSYSVTQEGSTERPFTNEYDKKYDDGIYVDIVSGEPLYSSRDKYDSGTGWPSFVRPISESSVVEVAEKNFLGTRIEIRSRIADSHLGHVFSDGPPERGGLRYCMNSAALRFIPLHDMERLGYAEFVPKVTSE